MSTVDASRIVTANTGHGVDEDERLAILLAQDRQTVPKYADNVISETPLIVVNRCLAMFPLFNLHAPYRLLTVNVDTLWRSRCDSEWF